MNFIKNNNKNIEKQHEFINEYENLKVGDIIIAKRYNDDTKMEIIPEGHREGPYIVIEKEDNILKCLYITGSEPKHKNKYYKTLVITMPQIYELRKTSYISIDKCCNITKNRFIKRLGHLNTEDKKTLFKKLNIVNNYKESYNRTLNIPKIPIEPGDIITNGYGLYLIINETKDEYNCIEMLEQKNELKYYIVVDGKRYYLNLDCNKNYSKSLEHIRVNFIDKEKLYEIKKLQLEKLDYQKHKEEICRGSINIINNIIYYVYGELSDKWLAFSVTKEQNEELCPIIIDNKQFYTNFNKTIEFNKNKQDIEIITLASNDEIDNIKNIKKSYIKTIQKQSKKTKTKKRKLTKKEIKSGAIIKYKNTESNYLHIVILRNQNELITIRYDKYLQGEYIINKFNVNQMELFDYVENFNLRQVLIDIQNIAKGYISSPKIKKLINDLEK